MQKFCVWDLFLVQFLCLFCLSLGQLVVSCSKWHLLASQLLLWANAWDRLLLFLGQNVLCPMWLGDTKTCFEIFAWNSTFYGLTEGLTIYYTTGYKWNKHIFHSISVSFSVSSKHIHSHISRLCRCSTNLIFKLSSETLWYLGVVELLLKLYDALTSDHPLARVHLKFEISWFNTLIN